VERSYPNFVLVVALLFVLAIAAASAGSWMIADSASPAPTVPSEIPHAFARA
jgi:hypothetical protein